MAWTRYNCSCWLSTPRASKFVRIARRALGEPLIPLTAYCFCFFLCFLCFLCLHLPPVQCHKRWWWWWLGPVVSGTGDEAPDSVPSVLLQSHLLLQEVSTQRVIPFGAWLCCVSESVIRVLLRTGLREVRVPSCPSSSFRHCNPPTLDERDSTSSSKNTQKPYPSRNAVV